MASVFGTSRSSSASSSTSSFKPARPPSPDGLEDEERKVLKEVSRKGYYHGRPRNGSTPSPRQLSFSEAQEISNEPQILQGLASSSCSTEASSASSGELPESRSAAAAWVLSARDQYSLLGATPSASEVDLRRCFLRTAVQVHPGSKRSSPPTSDADAFCSAAAAWVELGDLGSRWRYDMELAAGRGLLHAAEGLAHVPPPMDLEKAKGTFAFETWVCGQSTLQPPLDFSATLHRAQQLVEEDKVEKAAEGAVLPLPGDSEVTPASVACGIAVSAGLLAVGCAATAAGYPTIGSYARKGALYQGVSQAALGGMTAYQQGGGNIKETVSDAAERAGKIGAKCAEDPLGALFGGTSCLPLSRASRSCIFKEQHQRQQQDSDIEDSDDQEFDEEEDVRVLLAGDIVRIVGLQAAEGFNGRMAEVVAAIPSPGSRFQVRLLPAAVRLGTSSSPRASSRLINVKKSNLELANESLSEQKSCSRWEGAPASSTQFL